VSLRKEDLYGGSIDYASQTADITVLPFTQRLVIIEADGDLDVTLPDARLLTLGFALWTIVNVGSGGFTVTVKDADGTSLQDVEDGETVKMGLLANSTAAGEWVTSLRVFDSGGDDVPDYAAVGGSQGSALDDELLILFNHATSSSFDSATLSPSGSDAFRGGGAVLLGDKWHRPCDDNTPVGPPIGARQHWEYEVDTFVEQSTFTATQPNALELSGCGVAFGKILYVHIGDRDCWEWDVTDTWTQIGDFLDSGPFNPGLTGGTITETDTDGTVFCFELVNNQLWFPADNLNRQYVRGTETGADAPDIPVTQHRAGEAFNADDNRHHILGGTDNGSNASDPVNCGTTHYSYDMSLGTLGTWLTELSHPKNGEICAPGATNHSAVTGRVTLMGAMPAEPFASSVDNASNDDVWYFDQVADVFTFEGTMTYDRKLSYQGAANVKIP